MPGTIRVTVKEVKDLRSPAGRKYAVRVTLAGVAQETEQGTAVVQSGSAGLACTQPFDSDFVFTSFSLKDSLTFALLDSKGVTVGTATLPVTGVVSKGSRDELLSLDHGGRMRVLSSFTLTDAEKARIAAVKANAFKKRIAERGPLLPSVTLNKVVPTNGEEEDKATEVSAEGESKLSIPSASTWPGKAVNGTVEPGPIQSQTQAEEPRVTVAKDVEGSAELKKERVSNTSQAVAPPTLETETPQRLSGAKTSSEETSRILAELKRRRSRTDAPPREMAGPGLETPKGDIVPDAAMRSLKSPRETPELHGGDESLDGNVEEGRKEEDKGEAQEAREGGPGNVLGKVLGVALCAVAVVLFVPQLRPRRHRL